MAALALSVRSDGLLEQWAPPPANGVLAIDQCDEFARLWSALLFVFCMPPPDAKEESNYELFGDAPIWTACSIMHLLGQVIFPFVFWLFDVSNFLFNAHHVFIFVVVLSK